MNIVIATFVTCYAKLKLYEALSLPLKRILYYDTDSNTYHSANGDELDADEHIVEFCSTGPKCYLYITNKKVEVVHVKGFKLKNVSDLLNHESMLGMEIIYN